MGDRERTRQFLGSPRRIHGCPIMFSAPFFEEIKHCEAVRSSQPDPVVILGKKKDSPLIGTVLHIPGPLNTKASHSPSWWQSKIHHGFRKPEEENLWYVDSGRSRRMAMFLRGLPCVCFHYSQETRHGVRKFSWWLSGSLNSFPSTTQPPTDIWGSLSSRILLLSTLAKLSFLVGEISLLKSDPWLPFVLTDLCHQQPPEQGKGKENSRSQSCTQSLGVERRGRGAPRCLVMSATVQGN